MMTKTSRSALFLCAFGLFGGACSEAGGDLGEDGEGVGGAPVDAAGGDVSAGGSQVGSGGSLPGTGGASTGGGNASGGAPAGGASAGGASGGSDASGGAPSAGGAHSGGTSAGTGGEDTSGAGGLMSGSGGSESGTGGAPATCAPMGWATRSGRTNTPFALTGGGTAAPLVVKNFADLQNAAAGDTPRVIHIDGNLGAGWNGRSGDRLTVGSNKTIVGLRPGTQLKAPILIKGSSNVIIRNIVIKGPGSNSDQAWDNLNIEASKNVWIDHCEFWDGQDGNADVVKGADNVTFTWNIFGYRTGGEHNFSNLVASSDNEPESVGKLNITLMFNWFTGVAQRQPRCRYGDIHVVNNLFSRDGQVSDYGISAGKDCRVLTEANHFIDIKSPIYTNHASGSSAHQLKGNNIFENTSGNTTGYGTAFNPPYEYQDRLVPSSEVKALVSSKVGATLESPDQCD